MLDDQRIHRRHLNFWNQDKSHIVKKHPLLQKKGSEIANDAYKYVRNVIDTEFPNGNAAGQIHSAFQKILQLERGHEEELENLARRIVIDLFNIKVEDYGLPAEKLLDFKIGRVPHDLYDWQESKITRRSINEESEPQNENLNRRILRMMIAQGGAMHNFFSAFHLPYVTETLNNIDPRLIKLYKIASYGSALQYWDTDIGALMSSMGRAGLQGATNYVKYQPEQPKAQDDEDPFGEFDWDNFTLESYYDDSSLILEDEQEPAPGFDGWVVKAVGSIFPILIQEGIKGMLSLLTREDDISEEENKQLMAQIGKKPQDEVPYIQAGHELWRRLLKIKPRELSLGAFVNLFGVVSAKDANAIASAAVYMPQEATEMVIKRAQELGYTAKYDEPEAFEFDVPADPDLEEDQDDPDWWKNS